MTKRSLAAPRAALLSLPLVAAPLLGGATLASTAPEDDPQPWFEEVGAASGLDFQHVTGARGKFWFPEIMGGGVAFVDVNGDGLLDVYCVQSGYLRDPEDSDEAHAALGTPGNKLFLAERAEAGGQVTFRDITDAAGVGDTGYGMGVACADYDRDGDMDLYVTNVGANVLYRNVSDDSGVRFEVATDAGTTIATWSTSAAFVQANNDRDGRYDLFCVNNLGWTPSIETVCKNYFDSPDYCSPNNYNSPQMDMLAVQGRTGFQDASSSVVHAKGNGLGVAPCDFDGDGWMDLYVANDATENVLWRNEAVKGKSIFENLAHKTSCAVNGNGRPEAGMGVQWADLDSDGDFDLWVTHLRKETNTYYEFRERQRPRRDSEGNPVLDADGNPVMTTVRSFRDQSVRTGMNRYNTRLTGFGTGIHDFDLDGLLDVHVVNGAVQAWADNEAYDPAHPYHEPNQLFRGVTPRRGKGCAFEPVPSGGCAVDLLGTSRGSAYGDYDGDGDVDVVYSDLDGQLRLLRNVAPRAGNWIGFTVVDKRKKVVSGAQVGVTVGGRTLWRLAEPAYSYLASNDPRVHFGLGDADEVEKIVVRYPGSEGGMEEVEFDPLPIGQYHELRQNRGKAPASDKQE